MQIQTDGVHFLTCIGEIDRSVCVASLVGGGGGGVGGPDFTASLRHHCVSADELSVGRKGEGVRARRPEDGRETLKTSRERERERV